MTTESNSFLLKILTLGAVYTTIAWLTVEFIQEKPFPSVFDAETPAARQLFFGAAAGACLGLVQAAWLGWWRWWRELQAEIAVKNPGLFRAPTATIIAVSLVVGVTEEILFRAAIQPLVGIWAASVLFTVVHLNFDFSGFKKSDLPVFLLSVGTVFAVSLAMGFLFGAFGLLASIAAHTVYDSIVLFAYRQLLSSRVKSTQTVT